jgi:preprotein translocase subunit SecD
LWLTIIVVVAFAATMIAFMPMQRIVFEPLGINRDVSLRQGLDLSGGSQVLLEAENCATPNIAERLDNTRQIIENRINGLGVTEPLIQMAGDCRILVELPAVGNPADAIAQIQQTAARNGWTVAMIMARDSPHPAILILWCRHTTTEQSATISGRFRRSSSVAGGADLVPDHWVGPE